MESYSICIMVLIKGCSLFWNALQLWYCLTLAAGNSTDNCVSSDNVVEEGDEQGDDDMGEQECDEQTDDMGEHVDDEADSMDGVGVVRDDVVESEDEGEGVEDMENDTHFSIEEELRFSRRLEEGYDLFDPRYQAWLEFKHPDCCAHPLSTTLTSDPLQNSSNNFGPPQTPGSSSIGPVQFPPSSSSSDPPQTSPSSSSGPPQTPLSSTSDPPQTSPSSSSGPLQTPRSSPAVPAQSPLSSSSSGPSQTSPSSSSGTLQTPPSDGLSAPVQTLPGKSDSLQIPQNGSFGLVQTPCRRSRLPKFLRSASSGPLQTHHSSSSGLVQTPPNNFSSDLPHTPHRSSSGPLQTLPSGSSGPPHVPNSADSSSPTLPSGPSKKSSPLSALLSIPVRSEKPIKTGKARVLTSDECMQVMKEKEKKKREEAEQKAKRLEEKLQKKKMKEEEQKRKKAEMAKKKAEREAAKEAAKAKREAAKAAREASKQKQASVKKGKKRKAATENGESSGCSKKSRIEDREDLDAAVYSDLCCVCFGTYEEGTGTNRQWLQCKCERWIHEDCIDYADSSPDGALCPLC